MYGVLSFPLKVKSMKNDNACSPNLKLEHNTWTKCSKSLKKMHVSLSDSYVRWMIWNLYVSPHSENIKVRKINAQWIPCNYGKLQSIYGKNILKENQKKVFANLIMRHGFIAAKVLVQWYRVRLPNVNFVGHKNWISEAPLDQDVHWYPERAVCAS